MNKQAWRGLGWGLGVLLVVAGGPTVRPATAAAEWQAPAGWTDLGTVADWRTADTKFYRVKDDALFLDESHFQVDQIKEYARTRDYRGRLDGLGMAAWGNLPAAEQDRRRDEAARELRYLADFRDRIANQVQNTRLGVPSGWGGRVSDRTVVGTALAKLRTAVALDPSNPFAWHLYSYLASLVGDEARALTALVGAETALAVIPADALPQLRGAVALDRAWIQRDQGEFALAQTSLRAAADHGVRGLEIRLLQGLLAAQLGDDYTAISIAGQLRATPVAAFPPDFRSTDFSPELANVEVWSRRTSSYLQDWIMAYTWLRVGNLEMARAAFGHHRHDAQRPFAHRFWNEAGAIYEVTGRRALALQAWNQARVATPYYPYLVYKGYDLSLGKLTGRSGAVPYQLGFDSCFLNGNRLAYGAALVDAVAASADETQRRILASRALEQLEICQRFGVYAGQAAVLQGQVYYLMNDLESALVAVDEALNHLDAVGDRAGFAAVMRGLARDRHDLAPQDIANFYGQSGRSRGRWQEDRDPAATLAALREAFAADPSQDNRLDLARFLIRNGSVAEGRELVLAPLAGVQPDRASVVGLAVGEVELLLEADRSQGDTALALELARTLTMADDPWRSPGIWTLVGFICLDHEWRTEGKSALERAVKLDPGNHGLKIQLSMM